MNKPDSLRFLPFPRICYTTPSGIYPNLPLYHSRRPLDIDDDVPDLLCNECNKTEFECTGDCQDLTYEVPDLVCSTFNKTITECDGHST